MKQELEKHIEYAERLIKKLSPTVVVRELCSLVDDELEPLSQEEAENVVMMALDRQRRAYQRFQVSKETMIERYYDLYAMSVENKDFKGAKSILDKLSTELGLSSEQQVEVSGSDKIILKIE